MNDPSENDGSDVESLRRKSDELAEQARELRRQMAELDQRIREKTTRSNVRADDREWQLYDGKRITGQAVAIYFGATLRKSEVIIIEPDGSRWPLLIDDLSTDDIKWIRAKLGDRPVRPGESISLADDGSATPSADRRP